MKSTYNPNPDGDGFIARMKRRWKQWRFERKFSGVTDEEFKKCFPPEACGLPDSRIEFWNWLNRKD